MPEENFVIGVEEVKLLICMHNTEQHIWAKEGNTLTEKFKRLLSQNIICQLSVMGWRNITVNYLGKVASCYFL